MMLRLANLQNGSVALHRLLNLVSIVSVYT